MNEEMKMILALADALGYQILFTGGGDTDKPVDGTIYDRDKAALERSYKAVRRP